MGDEQHGGNGRDEFAEEPTSAGTTAAQIAGGALKDLATRLRGVANNCDQVADAIGGLRAASLRTCFNEIHQMMREVGDRAHDGARAVRELLREDVP